MFDIDKIRYKMDQAETEANEKEREIARLREHVTHAVYEANKVLLNLGIDLKHFSFGMSEAMAGPESLSVIFITPSGFDACELRWVSGNNWRIVRTGTFGDPHPLRDLMQDLLERAAERAVKTGHRNKGDGSKGLLQ